MATTSKTVAPAIQRRKGMAKKWKGQGYNDRMDESLGMRNGREQNMKQSLKDRRDEAKGMNKKIDGRAFSSVRTMDRSNHGKG
tara:strand:+ start:892 stop:1140 length:249 start_codon:yes stop_codon:yes gene_type:complete